LLTVSALSSLENIKKKKKKRKKYQAETFRISRLPRVFGEGREKGTARKWEAVASTRIVGVGATAIAAIETGVVPVFCVVNES